MHQVIESAVQIFRTHPELDDGEIVQRLMERGIERRVAMQLVMLVPLAYGRVTLSYSGVLLSDFYRCEGKPRTSRLSALPLWAAALDYAKQDLEPPSPLAIRSPEVKAANAALLDGATVESLVWGPPDFLWPIEPLPELQGAAKTSRWWRRVWDGPALHSVTHGERIAARVAMVIGILVGLLAVGVVGYYGISLLRELN